MSHKHLRGDLCFFIKKMKIERKDKAYFKTNGQFSNVCGKERRYREFTFLTSVISLSFLHTVTSMIRNVTSMTVSCHQAKRAHMHHKRNIFHFVIVLSLLT